MNIKRFILLSTLTFSLSSLVCAQSITERAERDEVTHMSQEEPAMREAFAKAKAKLAEFLPLASHPAAGTSGYALKVAIADGKHIEYFWVGNFINEGGRFTGVLNNEPRLVKKFKFGERFGFDQEQIVDWVYTDTNNRRMVGNFTACALLSKEPAEQAAAFQKKYGLQCE